jgi:tetratricopeptide (TPR) repeat protein
MNSSLKSLIVLLLSISVCPLQASTAAVEVPPSRLPIAEQIASADAAFANNDWAGYARIYRSLSAQSPNNGEYWYRLARAEQALGQIDAAAADYRRALDYGYLAARTLLRLASLEASRGHAELAVDLFEQARAHHLVNAEQALQEDPALAALLADGRWRARLFPQLAAEADDLSRWRTDLEFLARRLPETHWDLFGQVDATIWRAELKQLQDDLPTLENWQRAVRLMHWVRLGKSGHTLLIPPFQGSDAFHLAPIKLAWFADGLYVQAAPKEQASLVGQRVLKLGSATPEGALAALESLVPHENPSALRQFSPVFMAIPELLKFSGILEQREFLDLQLIDRKGRSHQERIAAPLLDMAALQAQIEAPEGPADWVRARESAKLPAPLWLARGTEPYWFESLSDERLIYFQFNAVRDDEHESLQAFATRLHAALTDADTDGLVIDLRHNRGGNGELLEPLLQALIAAPLLHQRGHLYVLIGGRTFSAAALFIGDLERQLSPIFVGEPSGAGPTHVGEDNMIVLPNTGQIVLAASRLFVRSFSDDYRHAVAPDLGVQPRFSDYRDNRDPVLDAVLGDWNLGQKTPSEHSSSN